jgi:plasmid segregation protein ParM
MQKTFIFPSVFEENYREYGKIANDFLEAIKIKNFKGKDYIIGEMAFKEGNSPHKFLNSSAEDLDYQLLGLIGLLIATQGTYSKLIVTTGFPFITYQPYKQGAIDFFKDTHEVTFDSRILGGENIEKARFSVTEVDVLTEVDGCIKAIRNGEIKEKDNFFIASLGYGTFEIALSAPSGLIFRTTHSSKGLIYAVSNLENELQKKYYLNLLTEQQIERAFQRGRMMINRKNTDLKELRAEALKSYYTEVVSPAIRKKFNDEDFYRAQKIYLVGGGAMYNEIVDSFKEEFEGILDIVVVPDPNLTASKGYCLRSMELAKQKISTLDDKGSYACVGLDLGNNNTVITVNNEFD